MLQANQGECIGCGGPIEDRRHDTCKPCDDAFDAWEANASKREERRREVLDSQGYYDDPIAWRAKYGR